MAKERRLSDPVLGDGTRKHSQWRDVWHRLSRNKLAMVALVIVVLLIAMCLLADVIAPYDYAAQDPTAKFELPSAEHWLGTDNYGRDLLSRLIVGGRISLLVSVLSVLFALIVGGFIGALAGYFSGTTDGIIMRLMDILMAIPQFLLAVAVSVALGSGVVNTAIAIAVGSIPSYARLMRASVMSIKDQEFTEAARALGNSNMSILFKHIIPNTLSPIIVETTLHIGANILAISGLSFVGLGVQPPTPEWGSIMASGRQYIRDFWPLVTFPGIFIMLTMFGFNILGDGLRDAMDPKMKK